MMILSVDYKTNAKTKVFIQMLCIFETGGEKHLGMGCEQVKGSIAT